MAGSERSSYPFWVAMGAAFVGTLLGGGAVWVGVNQRMQALASRESVGAAEPDAIEEPKVEPVGELEPGSEDQTGELGLDDPGDPGDSPLVRAIAATRYSVVTIELGGRAAGAGVVYDQNGTLLTNHHVIEPILRAQLRLGDAGASAVLTVRFVDGRERTAKVIAADPDEDVAILAIEPELDDERFAAAPLGRSGRLRLGEQVFSIGSPVGFEGTVATGIISALDRTGVLANEQLAVLQLDAAINFGNSGGPLFNLAGEIVGITTARSRRGEGIGFAIPIDRIRLFLRALEKGERGRSGVIGVGLAPNEAIVARIAPLGYHSGVAVSEVYAGRPAAAAGMLPGDVIVSLRGRRHDKLDASERGRAAFAQIVGETIRGLLPGESLTLEVVRGAEVRELELVVEAASVERQARIDAEELLGLFLDETADRPVIRDLVPGTPISMIPDASRILEGARIVSLVGRPVTDIASLAESLALLRSSGTAGGGHRSILIGFETADGQRFTANFPLAKG